MWCWDEIASEWVRSEYEFDRNPHTMPRAPYRPSKASHLFHLISFYIRSCVGICANVVEWMARGRWERRRTDTDYLDRSSHTFYRTTQRRWRRRSGPLQVTEKQQRALTSHISSVHVRIECESPLLSTLLHLLHTRSEYLSWNREECVYTSNGQGDDDDEMRCEKCEMCQSNHQQQPEHTKFPSFLSLSYFPHTSSSS